MSTFSRSAKGAVPLVSIALEQSGQGDSSPKYENLIKEVVGGWGLWVGWLVFKKSVVGKFYHL